jgi:hypothetical protein
MAEGGTEKMTQNLGRADRAARAISAIPLVMCGVLAPLSLELRLAAFVAPAVYLLATAIAGTCLGYRLLGRSTCAVPARSGGGPDVRQ